MLFCRYVVFGYGQDGLELVLPDGKRPSPVILGSVFQSLKIAPVGVPQLLRWARFEDGSLLKVGVTLVFAGEGDRRALLPSRGDCGSPEELPCFGWVGQRFPNRIRRGRNVDGYG